MSPVQGEGQAPAELSLDDASPLLAAPSMPAAPSTAGVEEPGATAVDAESVPPSFGWRTGDPEQDATHKGNASAAQPIVLAARKSTP